MAERGAQGASGASADPEGWLRDNGISTVRLEATNHDGLVLGKHLSASKFLSSLKRGALFADTCFGVDPSGEVAVGWDWGRWRGEVADIAVIPDVATLVRHPSLDATASAIGDFADPGGEPLPVCPRGALKRMIERLGGLGFEATVAPEIELMVFEEPLQQARAQSFRELTPLGGGVRVTYLMTRSADVTAFMDAAMRRLTETGVLWEYWSNETAPGQVEINLSPCPALDAADQVTRVKLALREVAEELGRTVSFMAWGLDQHLGGGMHINLSLRGRDGESAFYREDAEPHHSEVLRRWVAGLMATAPGAMSLLTPNVNSYRRLIEITGPPTTVTWGEGNKSVAVRTITDEPGSSRIEHRVPSGDCNIYLALASIIAGGIVGLEDELDPPPHFEGMAWGLPPEAAPRLPGTLKQAAAALSADRRLTEVLGEELVRYWLGSREWEWIAFHTGGGDPDTVGEYELMRYFEQA